MVKQNIPAFLSLFLSRPASALPKGAQWVVAFENLPSRILPGIKKAYQYEPRAQEWQTERAARAVLSDDYQSSRGCLFCQAIALPGESVQVNAEGSIKTNGFIRSYVGAGRDDFPKMRMTFLETNVSFADNFLRGWALSTSNFGMIARSKSDPLNYRTNLICYKIGTIAPDLPPFILMTMSFYDICCVSVSEEEYNYAPVTSPVMREAQFVYNSYSVNTTTGNSESMLRNNKTIVRKAEIAPPPIPFTPNQVAQTAAVAIQRQMAANAANLTNPNPAKIELQPSSETTLQAMAEQAVSLNSNKPISLFP